MKKLLKIIRFISHHPLTKDNKVKAILRFVKWQFISRLFPYSFIYPFVENTKLIVKKGMAAATGNVYVGLYDFTDMAFLLHFLRDSDLFGDIGANIGTYTILASGVIKAKSFTVEPIPLTFNCLYDNIKINNLEDSVSAFNKGVGATEDILRFTKSFDTVNHVVTENPASTEDTISVSIVTMDCLFSDRPPTLLKIDVEGFELNVLKGGINILKSKELKAIIIELNSSGMRYGISDEVVHNYLLSFNFLPYQYDPFNRNIESVSLCSGFSNTIYIKDKEFVMQRVSGSRKYRVAEKTF